MTMKHKIFFFMWSLVVRAAMISRSLQAEYSAYQYRAWGTGRTAMGEHEWLHRRWFPRKYDYEYACPHCGGHSTSYGLCMDCGKRWDIGERPARPL